MTPDTLPLALTTDEMILFGGMAALFVAAIAATYHVQGKVERAWEAFAKATGLNYDTGGFLQLRYVEGLYRERHVKVWVFTRGSGRQSRAYTGFKVRVREAPPAGLHLYLESFSDRVGKLFGKQDIQIGDATFDAAFIVRGDDEEAVRAWLTRERREALLDLTEHSVQVSEGEVMIEARDVLRSQDELERRFDGLNRCAGRIDP